MQYVCMLVVDLLILVYNYYCILLTRSTHFMNYWTEFMQFSNGEYNYNLLHNSEDIV